MSFFEGRVLPVGQRQKEMISKIIAEYTGAYETPLNLVYCYKMEKLRKQVFGSEQLIKNYIAEFLISFIRQSQSRKTSQISRRRDDTRLNMLVNYMNANLSGRITLDGLASYSLLNKTSINKLFTDAFHLSPIEYFSHLKIDLAKKYIRENNYNITQISELLGYSGVHYFSRQFKKLVGMTPSEYSKSIKALNESRP